MEHHLFWHTGHTVPPGVFAPGFRQIDFVGAGQAGGCRAHGEPNGNLAVVLFADLAAALPGDNDGVVAFLGKSNIVDDLGGDVRGRLSGAERSGGRLAEEVGHSRALLRRSRAGIDESAGCCWYRDGRPRVPRFCALRTKGDRGSSWLRGDGRPGVLPLAPDIEHKGLGGVRAGLAPVEVARPRQESDTHPNTVRLAPGGHEKLIEVCFAPLNVGLLLTMESWVHPVDDWREGFRSD